MSTVRVPLSQGKSALIDADDLPLISGMRWHAARRRGVYYVGGWREGRQVNMHRVILNAPDDAVVDHANGNPLDNRRANLRICTPADNARNRARRIPNPTGYIGVYQLKSGRYQARLQGRFHKSHIGVFDTPVEAARARDKAAKHAYGEFARLNFPDDMVEDHL